MRLHRGERRRRAIAVALLVSPLTMAGVALPAVTPFGAPGAGADQITATRRQIAQLQATVVNGAQRIHTLTVAYNEARFQASTLDQEMAQARAEITTLEARNAQVSSDLRQQALESYTGAYTGVPTALPPGRGPDLAVRAEYVSVASGNMKDSVDRFRAARKQLSAAQAQLAGEQRLTRAALAEVSQARQAALSEASADQAQLDHLQGQLDQLVAAEQAQQRARAAAAASSASLTTQGLPVNGGLVAVVQSVVAPAAAPVASAPALRQAPTTAPPPPTTSSPTSSTSSPPLPAASSGDGGAGGVWLQLRECESGDDYQANTGNGYFGAYQFSQQTWTDLGYAGRPDLESPAMQDTAAQELQARSGWGQWPACAAALGLS
jgi:peptidoglycan hydrolase CwlO-like protein